MTVTAQPAALLRNGLLAHPNRTFTLFYGTNHEREIRYVPKGDVISDPDCTHDFKALSSGLYTKVRVFQGDQLVDHRWLQLGPIAHLEDLLELFRTDIGDQEIRGIVPAVLFWKMSLDNSSERSSIRQAQAA